MSQCLQNKQQQCGYCKDEPKKCINLSCSHQLCLDCGKALQQTEQDQLIEAKFKIVCPQCSKMTRCFNIYNLIVDEQLCVKLIGRAPSFNNSPSKMRNSSQKNIENKSIQKYFSPSLQKNKQEIDQMQLYQSNSVCQSQRKGSTHSNVNPNSDQQQINQIAQQVISNYQQFNNAEFSTPQKLMQTIDSFLESSNQKGTQCNSLIKNSKSDIFNSGQNSFFNSIGLSASNSRNQNYYAGLNLINQSSSRSIKDREQKSSQGFGYCMSENSKKEQSKNLALQMIQRQYSLNNQQQQNTQSIYSQQFQANKILEPDQSPCKLISGNNMCNIVDKEIDLQSGLSPQESSPNIVPTNLNTQAGDLISVQETTQERKGTEQNCNQRIPSIYNNQNQIYNSVDNKLNQIQQESEDQDLEAKKRYEYYLNKRKEILKEQYSYSTHCGLFSELNTLFTEQQKSQPLKCNAHGDFMSLYDEQENIICCPSCIYENTQRYQKKKILPLKMCPQFINRDINQRKEILSKKLQQFNVTLLNSKANQQLLQDSIIKLNKSVASTFEYLHQQLFKKEQEIKNEIKRQYDEELIHYQKILCEIQPLNDNLNQSIKHFKQNPELDDYNNNLYYHSVLQQWDQYLDSFKRQVPIYTPEDLIIVQFPRIQHLEKEIENISLIKNIQENSLKDIIKRLDEAANLKQLNHITIPDNIVIKQTIAHYLKTTARSKGRNDFQISQSIEDIHKQSLSGVGNFDMNNHEYTKTRSVSKDNKDEKNRNSKTSTNTNYFSLQRETIKTQPNKKSENNNYQKIIQKQNSSNQQLNYNRSQPISASNLTNKNLISSQKQTTFKSSTDRNNQFLDNIQRNQSNQLKKNEKQQRNLFRSIIQKS